MNGSARVRVDGKQFAIGDRRFLFRGVTYGTFAAREDGAPFPDRDIMKRDFHSIHEAGFTVVRTYTLPSDDLVELASDWGLHLLVEAFYPDLRWLVGASRRQRIQVAREGRAVVREAARRLEGIEHVLALSVGNEIPGDVVRWVGTDFIADTIAALADTVRDQDPERLVTYANYPTAEYLRLDTLDFLTFNVFLERWNDFRRYLTRLQHLAGDRPLVLGEFGIDAGVGAEGEQRQADVLDWQLATAVERGVAGTCIFSWTDEWSVANVPVDDWHFGITRSDRSPRPALEVARRWNQRTVADLKSSWPSITVVICAYNAAGTLDECLRHASALDYPGLEILVVDDGSTDETPDIARRYPVKLVTIPHAGLSTARNTGFREARGSLVAYLDADAYPTAEWPYYLALGLDATRVGGVGGPNIPPPDDPIGAQVVARAPGGPVHVLFADDRAEHVPGCNMAFWRKLLDEVGGFDPVYTAAGDDVDLCWRVLDRGWEIAFHPAALVWHHRRAGARPYLRQQCGYGKAEALVEARHPDRFSRLGTARWRGRIYGPSAGRWRQRVYRGLYGTAAYQSVYQGGGYGVDVAHQLGVPVAAAALLTTPLAFLWAAWALLPAAAIIFLTVLMAVDAATTAVPRNLRGSARRFRLKVASLHILQPLVRSWGRVRARDLARLDLPPADPLPPPLAPPSSAKLLVLPADRPRGALSAAIVTHLRRSGFSIWQSSGWEDYDARIMASTLVECELVTSSHPVGCVQVRLRRRVRRGPAALLVALCAFLAALDPVLGVAVIVAGLWEGARGLWRIHRAMLLLLTRDADIRAVTARRERGDPCPGGEATGEELRHGLRVG